MDTATVQLSGSTERAASLQAEVIELRRTHELTVQELEDARVLAATELEEARCKYEQQNKAQLEDVVARYRAQFARAGEEARAAQAKLSAELDLARQDAKVEKMKWESRPARPEDLQRIASLETALRESLDRAAALSNRNRRLGLELDSQEQAFQRVYKKTPAVGKINPLAMTQGSRARKPSGGSGSSNSSNSGNGPVVLGAAGGGGGIAATSSAKTRSPRLQRAQIGIAAGITRSPRASRHALSIS